MEIIEDIEKVEQVQSEMDVLDYAKQIIACQIEIKHIQDEIKQIKAEAKENGLLVKEIDSAIKSIKRELKTNPAERAIEEEIKEKIQSDEELMASISMTI